MGIGNLNMSLKNVLLKNHLWTNPKGGCNIFKFC